MLHLYIVKLERGMTLRRECYTMLEELKRLNSDESTLITVTLQIQVRVSVMDDGLIFSMLEWRDGKYLDV